MIISATTANTLTAEIVNCRIRASNLPTSYGASGLPAGLPANTATGLLSGVPTTTGIFLEISCQWFTGGKPIGPRLRAAGRRGTGP